ncbi:MAG TPA: HAD-IIIA family hydrolase [Chitinophagaceae bacterium]|nr:HAD-IIIA family hydrolase [Chitinophagaceae bacterium]
MKSNTGVFLDLNGTLVLPLKQETLSEIKIIPGADIAIAKLIEAKLICPVVTIQSGIAKGRFTEQEFRNWFSVFFSDLNLDLKGPYICPHRFAENCICKKPNAFLYEQAANDYDIDLGKSYVIGDTALDIIAGKNFGGHGCLVRTGFAASESEFQNAKPYASYIGGTLKEVVDWILRNERND